MPKTFIIGDIHGCIHPLTELIPRIQVAPEDTIVFLGDYIDRGPASKDVVDYLLRLRKKHPHTIFLKGNHEQMLLDFLAGKDANTYLFVGGEQTLKSYGIRSSTLKEATEKIPAEHLNFFDDLLLYWENEHAIYVHAGMQAGKHPTMQSKDWLLWARSNFIEEEYDFGKKIIYGHTWSESPRIGPHKIGIDTGAVYGGKLTCLVLPEEKFIQVPSEKHWPVA